MLGMVLFLAAAFALDAATAATLAAVLALAAALFAAFAFNDIPPNAAAKLLLLAAAAAFAVDFSAAFAAAAALDAAFAATLACALALAFKASAFFRLGLLERIERLDAFTDIPFFLPPPFLIVCSIILPKYYIFISFIKHMLIIYIMSPSISLINLNL